MGLFSIVGLTFKGRVETPQRIEHHAFIYSFIHQIVKYLHVLGTVLGVRAQRGLRHIKELRF